METAGVIDATPALVRVISYWFDVAYLPAIIVGFVVFGWLIPRKR